MDLEAYIRKLARSPYWQNLYRASKDCAGIHLFKNSYNHSSVQSTMLYWLSIYDMLYSELAKQEWALLTEIVINRDIRTDAFLYARQESIKKQIQKNKLEENKRRLKATGKHKGNVTPWKVDMIRGE